MIIDWANIIYYQRIPNIALILKDPLRIAIFESEKEIASAKAFFEKIARNGRVTYDGKIFLPDSTLNVDEKNIASKLPTDIISEGEFSTINDSLFEKIKFEEIVFEITSYCNFHCPHCLLPKKYRMSKKFLNAKTIKEVLKKAEKMETPHITITGGEPTFYNHKNLIKLLDFTYDKFLTQFNTNAYNIDDDLAEKLAENVLMVKISIYGYDDKSYEKYTGVKNAFQKVKKGLELLNKYDANLLIDIIYTKVHQKLGIDVEKMISFGEEYCGEVRVISIMLKGWNLLRKDLLSTTIPEKIKKYLPENAGKTFHPYIRYFSLPNDPCALTSVRSAYITSTGWIYSCPFNDELVSHVLNPHWPVIYLIKVGLMRKLPWIGGRCFVKNIFLNVLKKETFETP